MDPEQIYQEVLQEEQGKGVSSAVAEGRAKAARVRAEQGSPHPKEAKWWPGSQPQFEGDGAAAEAETAEPEAPVEEEAPAEEAPAPAGEAAEVPTAEAPAAEAPPAETAAAPPGAEPEPAAPAPAEVAAPQPEPAAAPVAAAQPPGVTHGTATGTRLRPEDAVTTQSQFDAQKAMYERRKLIDDLVSSGAPAITAQEAGRPRAPFLAILYILIPLIAIVIAVSQEEEGTEAATGGETPTEQGGQGGQTIVAENIAFDTSELTFPAGEESTLTFVNNDSGIEHNVAIYASEADGLDEQDPLFDGQIFLGVATEEYNVPALDEGEYYFQCDVHKNMNGTATAE